AEALADVGNVLRVAEIAAEQQAHLRVLDHPRAPQRAVAVPRRALAPMLHRGQVQCQPHVNAALPPVELGDIAYTLLLEPGLELQRHEKYRRAACLPVQAPYGFAVEMIVVVVRDDHDIHVRQALEVETRCNVAPRTGEGK